METVTVFVYIVIAALLVPAVWFVWFGLDELVRPAQPRGGNVHETKADAAAVPRGMVGTGTVG